MSDGALSQEEIDALLQGTEELMSEASAPIGGGEVAVLSEADKQALLDVMTSVTNAQASMLSTITQKMVSVSGLNIESQNISMIKGSLSMPVIGARADYSSGIMGENLFLFGTSDTLTLFSIMTGQTSNDVDDYVINTVGEAVSQMMGAGNTAISTKTGKSIMSKAPQTGLYSDPGQIPFPTSESVIKITYSLTTDDGKVVNITEIMGQPLVNSILSIVKTQSPMGFGMSGTGGAAMPSQPTAAPQQPQVNFAGVEFPQIGSGAAPQQQKQPDTMALLMDVQMQVTVELGRTKMFVKDILGLGEGSIIELDKLAGEPVDLLINGKLVAKGEVVVIDENFGVRVTEIVSPMERFASMQ